MHPVMVIADEPMAAPQLVESARRPSATGAPRPTTSEHIRVIAIPWPRASFGSASAVNAPSAGLVHAPERLDAHMTARKLARVSTAPIAAKQSRSDLSMWPADSAATGW